MPALSPSREQARIEALLRYDLLDTPPDGAFDRITALATKVFQLPAAVINFVDADRVWSKSAHGIPLQQGVQLAALCQKVIEQEEVYWVDDASKYPATRHHVLVTGAFGLRFFAAIPLRTHDGFGLGALCLLGKAPKTLGELERSILEDLAATIMNEMELRLAAKRLVQTVHGLEIEKSSRGGQGEMVTLCSWSKRVLMNGQWISLEEFLVGHYGARVTHGITPEASEIVTQQAKLGHGSLLAGMVQRL